jgi:hypothetical protein
MDNPSLFTSPLTAGGFKLWEITIKVSKKIVSWFLGGYEFSFFYGKYPRVDCWVTW